MSSLLEQLADAERAAVAQGPSPSGDWAGLQARLEQGGAPPAAVDVGPEATAAVLAGRGALMGGAAATTVAKWLGAGAVVAAGIGIGAAALGGGEDPPAPQAELPAAVAPVDEPAPEPSPTPAPARDDSAPEPEPAEVLPEPPASPSPKVKKPRTQPRAVATPIDEGGDPGLALARELKLIEGAERALDRGDEPTARTLLARHRREFPKGQLAADRRALDVAAQCRRSSGDDARERAKQFLARDPPAAHRKRVRRACML